MNGEERRNKIEKYILESDKPLSATYLAGELGVSRQIIVGDVALLRANGKDIISTNKGYIFQKIQKPCSQVIKVRHKPEDMYDEFCVITDLGGHIRDEIIVSDLYGEIRTEINIISRADAKAFSQKCLESSANLLSTLTRNLHFHTIEADNELILIRIQKALNEKGYLSK